MAQIDPIIAEELCRDEFRSRRITTKCGYVSLIKDFLRFCSARGINDASTNISPQLAIWWMRDRVRRLGSCNSESSWSASLSWLISSLGGTPTYYKDHFYQRAHKNMIELWTIPVKTRKPIKIHWISAFLIHLNITPETWWTCDLELLTMAFLLLIAFFGIVRPAEILFSDSTENKKWEIISTGLKWSDITPKNTNKSYHRRYLQLYIRWYKNQEFRTEPKLLNMGPPTCNHKECKCHILNFYNMFFVLKKRRQTHIKKLVQILQYTTNKKQRSLLEKRINILDTNPSNYIFVGLNGSIWRPAKLTQVLQQLTENLSIPNPEAYPSYSVRIGASSLCHQQRIDLLKLVRYVIWSTKKFPHVSQRYIRFTVANLRIIPFEMIHGANIKGLKCTDRSKQQLTTFELTDQKVRAVLFDK